MHLSYSQIVIRYLLTMFLVVAVVNGAVPMPIAYAIDTGSSKRVCLPSDILKIPTTFRQVCTQESIDLATNELKKVQTSLPLQATGTEACTPSRMLALGNMSTIAQTCSQESVDIVREQISQISTTSTSRSYPEGSKFHKPDEDPCNLLGDTKIPLINKIVAGVTVNTPVGSISLDGCDETAAPALNGPGAYDGLQMFKRDYKGNRYGSAMGVLAGWTNFALPFVSIIAIIAIVYAGFLYITAFGNDEQTGKAKKIILWVVVGIVVIFSAYAIVNTVISGTSG